MTQIHLTDRTTEAESRRGTGLRAAALVLLGAALLLGACGRMGDPRLPAGQSDAYPKSYPAGSEKENRENVFRRAGRPD